MKFIITVKKASFEVEAQNEAEAKELGQKELTKIKEQIPSFEIDDAKLIHKDTGFVIN